ncbi:uncharacterized protein MONBRDRAFT_24698 [Monosiga brevicollis MX1]|uniref:Ribosomal RNA-processing protein 42 n=1 Tax=Monosiga brevicollis TaxID=81824 RepID=A9UX75_MONBE|nr:uncharacterized protein MONBRDRAFT_24698 [Monosiga brevicollis MX1]EDQ90341.1 predicted protein [Monosiga brevicollis MX1]|eukprot:XP_001745108.1 hypothetical protein [Monosiga brevicollis MX1]
MLPALVPLAKAEAQYILDGVQEDIRNDGRQRHHARPYHIETGLVSNANGSARAQHVGTDVLVGVKAERGVALGQNEDEGQIEVLSRMFKKTQHALGNVVEQFAVQFASSATAMLSGREREDYGRAIALALQEMADVRGAIDRQALCIIAGREAFTLKVDVMILAANGGAIYDTAAVAVYAALASCDIPSVTLVKDADGDVVDWEFADTPDHQLDVSRLPLLTTIASINDFAVLDATTAEMACADAAMILGIDAQGELCTCRLVGRTGGVDPELLTEMTLMAQEAGKASVASVRNALQQEAALDRSPIAVGFLR